MNIDYIAAGSVQNTIDCYEIQVVDKRDGRSDYAINRDRNGDPRIR